MRKGYEINFTSKTITITKSFSKKAQDPTSKEYALYLRLQNELPDFKILAAVTKSNKNTRKMTYDKMIKYISCQKDSALLLKNFIEVRELSKATPSPYTFVYKWFAATFPNYDKMPAFDSNGNIIPQYNLNTYVANLAEAGTKNAA